MVSLQIEELERQTRVVESTMKKGILGLGLLCDLDTSLASLGHILPRYARSWAGPRGYV